MEKRKVDLYSFDSAARDITFSEGYGMLESVNDYKEDCNSEDRFAVSL